MWDVERGTEMGTSEGGQDGGAATLSSLIHVSYPGTFP